MGGQRIERREVLRFIGLASAASTFPGFQRWAFACSHEAVEATSAVTAKSYEPLFFSTEHYRLVDHLAELIIPTDDTPGAKEAGVAEFIDFMVANRVPVSTNMDVRTPKDAMRAGTDIQVQFLQGLDWLNAYSKSQFAHVFMEASPEQQNSLLEEFAFKAKYKPTTETGREFFQLMRDYTVVGYYTSKTGLEAIGYPGLQMVWASMPGCQHHDDPEHAHLADPDSKRPAQLKIAN